LSLPIIIIGMNPNIMALSHAMDWYAKFDEPIPLPKGKSLVTLRDAALYITKLPKAEHDADVARRQPYLGATNWPWSQSIIALDRMGSPSFTAVLS
jgi:hypothetical protein